jgi:hypothetical protein
MLHHNRCWREQQGNKTTTTATTLAREAKVLSWNPEWDQNNFCKWFTFAKGSSEVHNILVWDLVEKNMVLRSHHSLR